MLEGARQAFVRGRMKQGGSGMDGSEGEGIGENGEEGGSNVSKGRRHRLSRGLDCLALPCGMRNARG